MRKQQTIAIGRYGSPFGVKGWIRVSSHTTPADRILRYQPWWLREEDGTLRALTVESARPHGTGWVVKLAGCDDPEHARDFTRRDILIQRTQMPPLPQGEYYWADLEGLAVITTEGKSLGRVDHLLATGSNDVLVVRGDRERLLPYRPEVIKKVDLDKGTVLVDWDPEF